MKTSEASDIRDSSPASEPQSENNEVQELRDEVAALKVELWSVRDAVRGAVAEKGTLAAKNQELEHLIHQLRMECDRLARLEQTAAYRLGNVVVKPLKRVQKAFR